MLKQERLDTRYRPHTRGNHHSPIGSHKCTNVHAVFPESKMAVLGEKITPTQ